MSISKINTNSIAAGASPTMTDLTLSGGLYVGGTGAANYLDDYEEGTWTPSLQDSGGSTLSGITYNTRPARYTKIGQLVTVSCYVLLSSASTDSSAAFLGSLPFTTSSTDYPFYRSTLTSQNTSSNVGGILVLEPIAGTSRGQIRLQLTTGSITSPNSNNYLGSSTWIMANFSYITDA